MRNLWEKGAPGGQDVPGRDWGGVLSVLLPGYDFLPYLELITQAGSVDPILVADFFFQSLSLLILEPEPASERPKGSNHGRKLQERSIGCFSWSFL